MKKFFCKILRKVWEDPFSLGNPIKRLNLNKEFIELHISVLAMFGAALICIAGYQAVANWTWGFLFVFVAVSIFILYVWLAYVRYFKIAFGHYPRVEAAEKE